MKHISDVLREIGWDDKLRELAKRVRCNGPDRRDPEKFHVERDEIAADLERMAGGQTGAHR